MSYKIQRIYFRSPGHKRTLQTGLTLKEAKAHCQDPETSSSTCKKSHNIGRTRRIGMWFDTFTEE